MRIGILSIGQVDTTVVDKIRENLNVIFPKTTCMLISEAIPMPEEAFNSRRNQYRSDVILAKIDEFARGDKTSDRILGIVDIDVFVPSLNFVFGEAKCPGKVALISLFRLRPEFHGGKPNAELFMERSSKEAVHEIGHTFGLAHCANPFCVMYFSNSIFDTDRKQVLFCSKCSMKVEKMMDVTGQDS
jgi:archaemetzincin